MNILKPGMLSHLASRVCTNGFAADSGRAEHPEIWLAQRTDCDEEARACDSLLTDEEKIRRERFRLAADRQRFALGRGWLRVLLGESLGLPPRDVVLQYGPHGKPSIERSQQTSGVYFNIAHSGDVISSQFIRTQKSGLMSSRRKTRGSGTALPDNFFRHRSSTTGRRSIHRSDGACFMQNGRGGKRG